MLLVGAPVTRRAWVLPTWFNHLRRALDPEKTGLVFLWGGEDDGTLDILAEQAQQWPYLEVIIDHEDDHYTGSRLRAWNKERYATMVRLRNRLLLRAREMAPSWYLSCDTDMLLPPKAFERLSESEFDGVAPLAYMTPSGELAPNNMMIDAPSRRRLPPTGFHQVEACFGVVLMNRALYSQVDYEAHRNGEDLGWALNARRRGLRLAVCTDVRAKHIMQRPYTGEEDARVGW